MESTAITWTISRSSDKRTEGVSLRVALGERATEVVLPAPESRALSRALRGPCADDSLDLWDVDHDGDQVWLTLYHAVRGMVRVSTITLSVGEAHALACDLDRHAAALPPHHREPASPWADRVSRWLRPAGQLVHRLAR
jgi:hypothetical protein